MNKIPLFNLKIPTLPILNRIKKTNEVFPIHRIYCVGRNYREHTIEMGGNPDKEPPFFFMKPNDAIVDTTSSSSVPYPSTTNNLHFEGELVVAIGKDINLDHSNIGISSKEWNDIANECIYGYAVGCDLTRRDLQSKAKESRRPWDASKGFDYSAPCGPIISKKDAEILDESKLCLHVNDVLRQESILGNMIWNVNEIIYYLSTLFHVKAGDLIMTGTPAGVGKLEIGDEVNITCEGLPPCKFTIGE